MTVLAGLRKKLGSQTEVVFEKGVDVVDENFPESDVLKAPPSEKVRAGIAAAVKAARDAEVVILVLGESDAICRESASRISLNLPGYQEELLEAVHATGKPVVLVLSSGRPLSINWAAKHVPAILTMWFPGEAGGRRDGGRVVRRLQSGGAIAGDRSAQRGADSNEFPGQARLAGARSGAG